MKAFCTKLAGSGFVVFAPDLYHGKVADNISDAETLGKALDTNYLQAKADIADATMFLNERVGQADRGLAVIGFSLGAYYALDLAAADPEHIRSVVIFYGTGRGDYSNSRLRQTCEQKSPFFSRFSVGIPYSTEQGILKREQGINPP